MKKLVSVILGSIFILVGSSCAAGGDSSPSASENTVIPDGYTRVDIDDEAKRYKFEGIGAQMDQCLFSGSYVGLDGIDANITDQDVAGGTVGIHEDSRHENVYHSRLVRIGER